MQLECGASCEPWLHLSGGKLSAGLVLDILLVGTAISWEFVEEERGCEGLNESGPHMLNTGSQGVAVFERIGKYSLVI